MKIIIGNKSLRQENRVLQSLLEEMLMKLEELKKQMQADKTKSKLEKAKVKDWRQILIAGVFAKEVGKPIKELSKLTKDFLERDQKQSPVMSQLSMDISESIERATIDRNFYQSELEKAITQRDYYKGICQNIAKKLETWEQKLKENNENSEV